jgi:hypothetical protein
MDDRSKKRWLHCSQKPRGRIDCRFGKNRFYPQGVGTPDLFELALHVHYDLAIMGHDAHGFEERLGILS